MAGREVLLVLGFVAAGCSSTTNNIVANCGAGTVLKDGVCVAAEDAAVDASGDTSVTADTSDSAAGDASVGDAPTDGDPLPGDDPCPVSTPDKPIEIINCSKTCPPIEQATCKSFAAFGYASIGDRAGDVYVIRTPAKPGTEGDKWRDPACPLEKWYAGRIEFGGGGEKNDLRVRVAPPWFLVDSVCSGPKAGTACIVSGTYLYVVTTDPNAPSRNVEIEVVPTGTASCP